MIRVDVHVRPDEAVEDRGCQCNAACRHFSVALRHSGGPHTSRSQKTDDLLDGGSTLAGVMSIELATIRSDENAEAAIDLIASGAIHSVLVVDREERLVGIVTDTDLLEYLCS